jgi:hypothetical protein
VSEYQYYEFIALDRALTKAELQELRNVSSRAEISSTRFANTYNYGDFRGDESEFMTRYFDAMVYVANWGTHRFMLRLPGDLVDRALLQAYCPGDSASLSVKGKSVVLDFSSNLEDYAGWEEGEGWLSSLAPLRTELIHGDLRALYLAWLLCAQCEELDEDMPEPPVPPGLKNPSEALQCLIEFLRIDPDLLAVAAEHSGEPIALPAGIEAWITALPEAEKNALLLTLIKGQDPHLGAGLLQRYRASVEIAAGTTPTQCRTVGELLAAADRRHEAREQAEARRQAEARANYLDELALREDAVWQRVEDLVALKQAKAYAEAIGLLKDLQELNLREDKVSEFERRFGDLCNRHQKKRGFIDRIKEARLQ